MTVTRELRARLWLALRLFRLGAWVLGPRVRFETTDIQDSEEHY
ncbi:MAG: hypothetical protein U5L11_02510 [Arhodomonas sp.]|nr:hypothetical protein [Arhodomonas sp.]